MYAISTLEIISLAISTIYSLSGSKKVLITTEKNGENIKCSKISNNIDNLNRFVRILGSWNEMFSNYLMFLFILLY